MTYPANFILVATANPCPCGYYGSNKCVCLPHQILHYQHRLSGPIIDRIDLFSTVRDVNHRHLLQPAHHDQHDAAIQARVEQARKTEANRYDTATLNADMTTQEIKRFAQLEPAAKDMLDTAAERLAISARGYMKTVKVACTIADLESSRAITTQHITEALQFRRMDQAVL